ncbi:transposase [Brumimicrobium glaciale]|uniref:Transposase n=1 Tax=Brumimicrobium glaciale TaxID=200475 RepID=A0A4Q4KS24_9FLAO|nr:transposase [Brumimicrobium glaciale]RYM34829.1 transposase [Brumimicrobium glaciale]
MFNPEKHHRKSVRLKGYDYSSMGFYFITVNVEDKLKLLSRIENGKLELTKIGQVLEEEWKITEKLRKNIQLHDYVIMPNHFHAIVEIRHSVNKENEVGQFKAPKNSLGAIVRGFKGAVTRKVVANNLYKSSFWQRSFDDRIIKDEPSLMNVKKYINDNVRNWDDV